MTIHTHTLSNGLRIIHREFTSEISYCGIAINTGARDEYPDEFGMAHFVEHMLFKGTKQRKAHHIANRMENVGGDLNAYTTKEETFIYATFLHEYFPRALELLSDIIHNSEFPQTHIDREREVILDEINSYDDSPSDLIYDDFENLMFYGHDFGHYILGDPETIKSFNTDKIRKFVKRQYKLSEMVLFSFGKTSFTKIVKLAEKYFPQTLDTSESVSGGQNNKLNDSKQRVAPSQLTPTSKRSHKSISQSHVVLGWNISNMFQPEKYILYLLNSIMGGGSMNSRLNTALREKNGLVYHVESNLVLYTDTGLFTIYFASDPKNKDKCLRLIHKELKKIMEIELTNMQLTTAKRQWKGQLGIASENNENSALNMAKSYLHFNRYTPIEDVFLKIDEITSKQLKNKSIELFSRSPFELMYFNGD